MQVYLSVFNRTKLIFEIGKLLARKKTAKFFFAQNQIP